MSLEVVLIDHDSSQHQDWLREAWGWLQADPDRYNHDGRYSSEAEFLCCPTASIEWAVFYRDQLQAIVTATFDPSASCSGHVTSRPRPVMSALLAALHQIEAVVFRSCTDVLVTIPDLPPFAPTRKLAQAMGYRKVSNSQWVKWFYEQRQ